MEVKDALDLHQPRDVVHVPHLWFLWSLAYGAFWIPGLRWYAGLTTPKLPAALADMDWDTVFQPMFSWPQALEGMGVGCLFAFGLWLTSRVVFHRRSPEHRKALFMLGLMCAALGIVIVAFAPVEGGLFAH